MNYFALAMANKIRYIVSILQIAKLATGALAPEEIFEKSNQHSAISQGKTCGTRLIGWARGSR